MTPAQAATAAAPAVVAAAAANPCAPKPIGEENSKRLAMLSTAVAARGVVLAPPPQPQIVFQTLDPIRAMDAAWREASEQVMTLVEAKHPLSDDERTGITTYDDEHKNERDRFLFRLDLLKQVVEQ